MTHQLMTEMVLNYVGAQKLKLFNAALKQTPHDSLRDKFYY